MKQLITAVVIGLLVVLLYLTNRRTCRHRGRRYSKSLLVSPVCPLRNFRTQLSAVGCIGRLWRGISVYANPFPSTPLSTLPVNRRNQRIGTRKLGFGLNPRVELAPPHPLLPNWRDRPVCKNVRNVADTGNRGGRRCCQVNRRGNLVRGRYGSPEGRFSNWLSTCKHLKIRPLLVGRLRIPSLKPPADSLRGMPRIPGHTAKPTEKSNPGLQLRHSG